MSGSLSTVLLHLVQHNGELLESKGINNDSLVL